MNNKSGYIVNRSILYSQYKGEGSVPIYPHNIFIKIKCDNNDN